MSLSILTFKSYPNHTMLDTCDSIAFGYYIHILIGRSLSHEGHSILKLNTTCGQTKSYVGKLRHQNG